MNITPELLSTGWGLAAVLAGVVGYLHRTQEAKLDKLRTLHSEEMQRKDERYDTLLVEFHAYLRGQGLVISKAADLLDEIAAKRARSR